jgi:A118 family predicted phage portal protein
VGEGEQRAKLHVPLAADICGTSADLLFSESVTLSSGGKGMQEWLDGLQDDGLDARLHEAGEVTAALGGTFLRTVWDTDVSPRPWTEVAHPDGAVPEFRGGRLQAVSLWSELSSQVDGVVHRLVERHEPGVILYALYEGTALNLGRAVPLTEHPEAAYLANVVDAEGGQATGTRRLTATYVPNMLPNRLSRHSPQGRSDLQGVTPLLDALDEAYSSWWRDIRHAKSRIHVPEAYLESAGPGNGAVADIERELYVPVAGVLGKPGEGLMINAHQFAIRVAEHAETCREWTARAVESAGYSTQSLSSDTGGAVTAAEVHAKNRRSYMTRGKKVRYWRAALRHHLVAQAEVANAHLGARLAVDDVRVTFPDGVQESQISLAHTAQALRNAEAASVETRVRLVQPDLDDDAVAAEVARIVAETGTGDLLPAPDAGF